MLSMKSWALLPSLISSLHENPYQSWQTSAHLPDEEFEFQCLDNIQEDIIFIETHLQGAFHLNGFYLQRIIQLNDDERVTAYVQFQGEYFLYHHLNKWMLSKSLHADHGEAYTMENIWTSENQALQWKLFVSDEDLEQSREENSIDIALRVISRQRYESIYHAIYHARRLEFENDPEWKEKHR